MRRFTTRGLALALSGTSAVLAVTAAPAQAAGSPGPAVTARAAPPAAAEHYDGTARARERRARGGFGPAEVYGLVLAGGAVLAFGGLAVQRRRRRLPDPASG